MIDEELLGCFLDEALDALNQWERACLDLETNPTPEIYQTLFRAAHNIKGASRTVGLENFGALVHTIEDLIKLLMEGQLELDQNLLGMLLDSQVKLVEWIGLLRGSASAEPDVGGLAERIKTVTGNPASYKSAYGTATEVESESVKGATDPVDELQALFLAAQADYEHQQTQSVGALVQEEPKRESDAGSVSLQIKPEAGTGAVGESKVPKQDETIRISAVKLDELLQLIGELSIHQSIVFQAKRSESLQSKICHNAIHLTNKIVKDLYGKALSLRMQPVQPLFQRLERVARDVARAQGKKINIELEGTEVELDKTVIERITDPLTHILRNAVDHGIETIEERKLTNKSETATVRLIASQDPAGVCIKVSEDGRGLNREKILKKALEKGLVSPSQNLSPGQINNLIFLPGFSTADQVTDISGRGVGMDVVTKAVQALQGSIDISSERGQGTTFSITLPTSLSIVDALVIKISDIRYAVAMHELTEIIDLAEYTIDTSGNKGRMISIRGEVVPLQNLREYFRVPIVGKVNEAVDAASKPALVVRESGATVAFEVDTILGQQQVVVRPLSQQLGAVPGFSGSMIMGDGEPGMIVSLSEVARAFIKTTSFREIRV